MRELQIDARLPVLSERAGGGAGTAGDDDVAAQNRGATGRGPDVLSGLVNAADEHEAETDGVSSFFFGNSFICLRRVESPLC